MSAADTVSRPYAQAIFEIAIQNNTIEEWKNILIFIKMIACHKKVRSFLSGSLSPEYLSLVFTTISSDIINENAKNLIKLLAKNQRFKILNNILKQFLKLESYYKDIIIVELRSAFTLKEKQINRIKKILEESFLRKVKFIYKVNPEILDGIIIKVNDTVFDLSIQNHLKQLSDALNL
ncbi:F0F1 ATP synthase subunit delta [Buchnera aphidicola (Acyrthosiphon lactucae)]|uniref:ATP synthase subunit delta n=1 Tax=Buchnera aphidicola (Acyrthosiphon lactucae) TaxID=1241832 RepID=A0A4D6XV04_9GAMM|nr:F0F1 ATP synthase subunit delta [Buchnera aphidicola]QCI17431.1 F0F1 ATP synthase subunit delta [Buchnera aphidicola (Acyrthosiphon lactucae)]